MWLHRFCSRSDNMRFTIAAAIAALTVSSAFAEPVPEQFTYQGVLEVDGDLVQTDADFVIRLYDGASLVESMTQNNVTVNNGRFMLNLGFNPANFDGTGYELEFLVRSPAGVGSYETLGARQPLSTVPYAYHANTADAINTPAIFNADAFAPTLTLEQDETGPRSALALRATRGLATRLFDRFIQRIVEVESDNTPMGILATAYNFPFAGIIDADAADSNVAAVLGQVTDQSTSSRVYALWGYNQAGDTEARLATNDYAGEFYGEVRFHDEVTKQFAFGAYDPATPVAYGFVFSNGSVGNGTPNYSVVWNAGQGRYEIEIDDESYFFSSYVTSILPLDRNVSASVTSGSGRMFVYLRSTADQSVVQGSFQFMTYKPTGSAAINGQRRAPLQPINSSYTDQDFTPNPIHTARQRVESDKTTQSPIEAVID